MTPGGICVYGVEEVLGQPSGGEWVNLPSCSEIKLQLRVRVPP